MANKSVFTAVRSVPVAPVTNTVNAAGGRAYSTNDKQTLAQIAATNTFQGTYYDNSANVPGMAGIAEA
jgi:hypothetical protein